MIETVLEKCDGEAPMLESEMGKHDIGNGADAQILYLLP